MRFRPNRYQCPFATLTSLSARGDAAEAAARLLIQSDLPSDEELRALKSFSMWDLLQQKWKYTLDWEEHKREMIQHLDAFHRQRLSPLLEASPRQTLHSRRIQ